MADSTKSEVLEVAARGDDELVILAIVYEEGDIGAAVGQLFSEPANRTQRSGAPRQLLSTNDTLRHLWVSPGGNCWVGSADGNIGTTAGVQWPAPRRADLRYRNVSGGKWNVTSLPALKSNGLPPSVTALWGIDDTNIHVGTYGGHLYHWNGRTWNQVFEGPGEGRATIRAIGGASEREVYAVGANSTVLSFNGAGWVPLRLPIPADEDVAMTAIRPLSDGEVFFSGMGDEGGVLFHGNAQGLAEFARSSLQLIDMAGFADRTLLATDQGAAELLGREVALIKEGFSTVGMSAGLNRWFFIQPAQEQPGYIEYDPTDAEGEWMKNEF